MKLSAAEYEIMECVWTLGRPVSGMDIMRALGQEKGWKQPTVLTFLSRLVEKGLLETEKRGKLRSYTAAMTREAYKNSETRDFLAQLYGGSVQNLVACMADGGGIPPEELEALRVQVCLAVDFPEEEVECLAPADFGRAVGEVAHSVRLLLAGQKRAKVMQQGAVVVLAGAVNAGKSSLLNALLGRNRALVTDIPGTTRDFLEEACDLDGLPVRLTDTAGLRRPDADAAASGGADAVEALGMALSREKLGQADCILLVLDGARLGEAGAAAETCPDAAARQVLELAGDTPVLLVWNKSDLCAPAVFPPRWSDGRFCCMVSARSGDNVDALAQSLRQILLADGLDNPPSDGLAPNARQALALEEALAELEELEADVRAGRSYDCCAVRLDTAAARLGEVTGLSSPAEVLDRVFAQFCIGK